MKKIEKVLLGFFLVGLMLSLSFEGKILSIVLFLLLLVYLFGGYFIFKPKEKTKNWKIPAILNGILYSFCLFLFVGKTVAENFNLRPLLLLPIVFLTSYYAFKALKKDSELLEKAYFKLMLIRNSVFLFLIISILIIPERHFAAYLHGYHSEQYYAKYIELSLDEADELEAKNQYKEAIDKVKKALMYAEMYGDRSSILYHRCLRETGYIYYRAGEYKRSAFFYDKILDKYDIENPLEYYDDNSNYAGSYYHTVYNKAVLFSSWGYYTSSDSLYNMCKNYYKNDITFAYIHHGLGDNERYRNRYLRADSLYTISLKHHERNNYPDIKGYLWTLEDFADNFIEQSKFNKADSVLQKCYKLALEEYGNEHIELARVTDKFVSLHLNQANYEEAEKFCIESLRIKEKSYSSNHKDFIDSSLDLATIYLATSRYMDSEVLLRKLQSKVEIHFEPKSYISTRLYNVLTQYHEDFMNYDKALLYGEKSVNANKYRYGEYSLSASSSYHNLASVYYHLARYDKADSLYYFALDIQRFYKGMNSPGYAASLNGLGLILLERDSLKLAREYLDFCLEVYQESYGKKNEKYATILFNQACLNRKEGNYEKADKLFLDALVIYRDTFKDKHIKIAKTLNELGNLEHLRNRNDKALVYQKDAFRIWMELFGENHYYVEYQKSKIAGLEREIKEKEI